MQIQRFTMVVELIAILFFANCVSGMSSQIPDFTPEMEEKISSLVESVISCRNIPGLTMTVVHKGEVVMQRGFGVTDVNAMEPVTEDTLFAIGSVSKAFTANLLAILLAESNGMYTWDTRLQDVLGENFALTDEVRTQYTTIRDLLSHKVNLYTYPITFLTKFTFERDSLELCSRMKYKEAASGFRTDFIYDDMMFVLAGCVAEVIGGANYSELLKSRILEPLNMTSTVLTSGLSDLHDLPSMYRWSERDQELLQLDPIVLDIYPMDPAGAICSNARDMGNWMLTQLNSGIFNGQTVVPLEFWQSTLEPCNADKINTVSYSKPTFPFYLEGPVYGLGWWLGTYQGYKLVYHPGQIGGFVTILALYPDMQSAVFISTNHVGNDVRGLAMQTTLFYTTDLLFGEEPFLNETTVCTFPEPFMELHEANEVARNFALTDDSLPPVDEIEDCDFTESGVNDWINKNYDLFVGDFGHLLFGNFSIQYNDTRQQLTFTQGGIGEGPLLPINVEEPTAQKNFFIAFEGALYNSTRASGSRYVPINFQNLNGVYQELVATGYEPSAPPVFVRGLEWNSRNW